MWMKITLKSTSTSVQTQLPTHIILHFQFTPKHRKIQSSGKCVRIPNFSRNWLNSHIKTKFTEHAKPTLLSDYKHTLTHSINKHIEPWALKSIRRLKWKHAEVDNYFCLPFYRSVRDSPIESFSPSVKNSGQRPIPLNWNSFSTRCENIS